MKEKLKLCLAILIELHQGNECMSIKESIYPKKKCEQIPIQRWLECRVKAWRVAEYEAGEIS